MARLEVWCGMTWSMSPKSLPHSCSARSSTGGDAAMAASCSLRACVTISPPGAVSLAPPTHSPLWRATVTNPLVTRAPGPSSQRSTMAAAPQSPRLSEASWRLSTDLTWGTAFSLSDVMYSPDTTMPRRITPRLMKSVRMYTPVSMPAQALATSKAIARRAPMASRTKRDSGGSNMKLSPSLNREMEQLSSMSMSSAP